SYSIISTKEIEKISKYNKNKINNVSKEYGKKMINKLKITKDKIILSRLKKINLLTVSSNFIGLHASFTYDENTDELIYKIKNCPFKELASKQDYLICNMHNEFLTGMFKEVFTEIEF